MRGPLSFYSFCTHLISKKWNYLALIPEANRDLSLIDYYIYSSHNTYLSGNQLTSDSKVERYMEDLKRGVKCMEIDIHDEKGEPIVTHAIKGFGVVQYSFTPLSRQYRSSARYSGGKLLCRYRSIGGKKINGISDRFF